LRWKLTLTLDWQPWEISKTTSDDQKYLCNRFRNNKEGFYSRNQFKLVSRVIYQLYHAKQKILSEFFRMDIFYAQHFFSDIELISVVLFTELKQKLKSNKKKSSMKTKMCQSSTCPLQQKSVLAFLLRLA